MLKLFNSNNKNILGLLFLLIIMMYDINGILYFKINLLYKKIYIINIDYRIPHFLIFH